ncbi:hypothetical protein CNY89_17960 [Amaricoccus sp. HAR-UPW-R2A-40]|nr:hypothetical protein CNY89_17960 [Amaricoccus sp. HAR-UPW-R2A-40]
MRSSGEEVGDDLRLLRVGREPRQRQIVRMKLRKEFAESDVLSCLFLNFLARDPAGTERF